MPLVRAGGYGHRIYKIGDDEYLISWSYDTKPNGVRYRIVKRSSRYTDKKGAIRFAKKWNLLLPEKTK